MATRYAVANGNWSSTSTWDGGTLPSSTDDIFANNKTVTIDQTITVNSLANIANTSPSIAAGGKFVIASSRTVTVTSGFDASSYGGSSWIVEVSATSGTVTLNGPIYGGTAAAVRMVSGANCTLNINGDIYGWYGSGTSGALEVYALSPTVNITCDYLQGDSGGAGVYLYQSNATLNVVAGTIVGYSSGDAIALNAQSSNSAHINVTGKVFGGSATGKHGISVTGATDGNSQVKIIGSVAGGIYGAYGVSYISGNVIVDGEVNYFGDDTLARTDGVPPIVPTSPYAWAFALVDNSNKKFVAASDAGLPHTGTNTSDILELTGSGGGGGGPIYPASGLQWPIR